jgi:maltose alpha-D-glucosyltransferase/alpha-amylase
VVRRGAADRDGPRRGWYVWRDEPSDEPKGLFFPDKETSNWAYDEEAGQWYLHRFYSFQPDLDTANQDVRDEIARIMGFWLELGVAASGSTRCRRCSRPTGCPSGCSRNPQEWLRHLRAFASRRRGDAMLLGEVNVGLKDLASYFGEHGEELHMQSAFLINQHLWLALARRDAEPLENVIRELPPVPRDNAWATFLRNHDELSLDRLTAPQRDEVFAAFAPTRTCDLRPRHPPARGADAGRRPGPAADGLEPDVLAARLARAAVRRRDRPGRRPRAGGPHGRARADAVVDERNGGSRRRRPSSSCAARRRRVRAGQVNVTPSSGATRSRC